MIIDKAKLKDLAQAVAELEDIPERQDEHAEAVAYLETHMHCHTILGLLAEIERLEIDNRSLKGSCSKLGAEHAGMSRLYKKANRMQFEARQERDQLNAENEALRKIISESATACGAAVSVECSLEFMAMLPAEIGSVLAALRKDAELIAAGRAKLAGAMSRLRAKHNDWAAPESLPAAELVWCACGDGFPPNSYGAGFMDANNGVCWSCDAAKEASQ